MKYAQHERRGTVALTDLGYRVTAHTNSRVALEVFRDAPDAFDLVITDQTMPHLTGDALAQEILRLRPRLPVILCTGGVPEAGGPRPGPLGVRATLLKPVSRLDLSLAVRCLLVEQAAARNHQCPRTATSPPHDLRRRRTGGREVGAVWCTQ